MLSRPTVPNEPKRDLDLDVGSVGEGAVSVGAGPSMFAEFDLEVGEMGGEIGDGSPWWMATLEESSGG